MAIIRRDYQYEPLSPSVLERWRAVPPAVAGDNLNRDRSMGARVAPVAPGLTITGHARTLAIMAGDNGAVRHASAYQAGEVLVIAARGSGDVAIIGEIVVQAAKMRSAAVSSSTVPCGYRALRTSAFLFAAGDPPWPTQRLRR